LGDYGLRGINAHYGAVGDIGAEPGGDVNDFEVWLDGGRRNEASLAAVREAWERTTDS
jgi:hypothetical protein